jgi:hypothetical protein
MPCPGCSPRSNRLPRSSDSHAPSVTRSKECWPIRSPWPRRCDGSRSTPTGISASASARSRDRCRRRPSKPEARPSTPPGRPSRPRSQHPPTSSSAPERNGRARERREPASASAATPAAHLDFAEAALRLLVSSLGELRVQSRGYIGFRLDDPEATQTEIAESFGVSQQAVSRVLAPGTAEIIAGAQGLAAHHLGLAEGARNVD